MTQWLRRLLIGTRFEPLARELERATWPRYRAVDDRDRRLMIAILSYVLREDSCCVDVGAHTGDLLAQMVRLAPRGRHWAFEPLPHLAADLRQRFPTVEVREAALSDS
jgi:hypothetical protein